MESSDGTTLGPRRLLRFLGALVAASLLWVASPTVAQERSPALVDLPELTALDGASFDLAALVEQSELTVLFWFATRCPCVVRYQERIEAIASRYAESGVSVVAVGSNADDTLSELVDAAAIRNLAIPIVHDASGALAQLFNVRTTPTTVVLDSEGEVVFWGWIDNERHPGQAGREPWLENTLQAALAGTLSGPVTAPHWGCNITRPRGRRATSPGM